MTSSRESTIAGVGTAHLAANSASLDDDGYTIHGIALGVGDITVGQSGIKKLWPAEELKKAADSLEGTDLVRDHINTTEGKIGTVTHAEYLENVGVIYEAEIAPHYEEIAQDVKAGLMEVSVRAYHNPVEELDEDEETGALIVENVLFDNLSVVNNGASPSNTANAGPVEDIENQYGTVEASAVFGDGQSAAVLSRSEAVLEADEDLAYGDDGDDEQGLPSNDDEFGYVEVEHQITDGTYLTVKSAWAQMPFYLDAHVDGDHYDFKSVNFSGSIGDAGPFEAYEEVEDVTIELDEQQYDSCNFYIDLHYVEEDGSRGTQVISGKYDCIFDAAVAVVEDDDAEGMEEAREALESNDTEAFEKAIEQSSMTIEDTPTEGKPKAKGDQLAPSGIFTADGTWFAVAPDEHSDDSTSHAEDAKYPLTSCTGENSVEAAWNLRGQGHYDIDQSTLETRIKRAAEAMGCELSFMDGESNSDVESVDSSQSTESMKEKDYAEKADFGPDHDDVFENEEDAEERAQELGIDGTHTHEWDGETYYMPGSSHDMYLEAIEEMAGYPDIDPDLDGYIPVGYRNGTMHHDPRADVRMSDQEITDGTVTIDYVESSRRVSPSIHVRGKQYLWMDPPLSGNYGSTEPLEPGINENVEIELDKPLPEGEEAYVILYYVNDEDQRVHHVMNDEGFVIDKAQCTGGSDISEKSYHDEDEYSSTRNWSEGDKVQWQARPDMFGRIVHNPSDEHIVMVELYEETESGYEPTGYTLTAGYGDLVPMKAAEKSYHDDDEYSEELEGYEVYEPQYEETTDGEWSDLSLDDWGFDSWDDMNEVEQEIVAEHFLLSSSGSTPDDWDDLALPVVDADGALNANAVEAATEDVESMDVDDSIVEEVYEWAQSVLEEEFDMDEMSSQRTATVATTGTVSTSVGGNDELHSTVNMIDYQTADPEELGDELDDPVVVEKEELEQMAEQAQKADSVEDELSQLSEKLDEQSEASKIVADLSDEEVDLIQSETEASVVEASQAEMFDEVQTLYAEELAEHYPGMTAESLASKFSPSELKEMVEEHGEAELSSSIKQAEPEPEGGAASDEELSSTEADKEAEELREEYAAKLEKQGWTSQARKVREGEIPITAE